MYLAIGFLIAAAVGMTGIGGGSFTVPALVLLAGLAPEEAVGTAFVFSCVLRLLAAPFYMIGKKFHRQYLRLLLLGAVPGLAVGTILLREMNRAANNPVTVIVLGILLSLSSGMSFVPRFQRRDFARKNSQWLPWLALPIGVEAGFSSAGAGALGTVLLLNFSEMTPAEVVGTDLLFGFVLAAIGSTFHWEFGAVSVPVLWQLLAGGVPGVVIGGLLARKIPARKLKYAVAAIALLAGLQLVWHGAHALLMNGSAAIRVR
jgi:uncharacterized protein